MLASELREMPLFASLPDAQLDELLDIADEVPFTEGEALFTEATPADDWWVLLDGAIQLTRRVGREETALGRMEAPGQWAGGFRAWDPHGVYLATGRGHTPGRVLRVPAARLAERAEAWFPLGVHFIKGLMGTVRRIETVTREREALIALGTLSAGLAHEINNPASAAARAVPALDESTGGLLVALRRLADLSITADQFAALDELRGEVTGSVGRVSDPLRTADAEDALSDWLIEHDIDRDWLLAPALAAAGATTEWCDRVAAILDGDALQAGLDWVTSALVTSSLLDEIRDSTRRVSQLVGAVKSYSQLDRASVQRTDVVEGLESTLVMLNHKLKDGVTVERTYEPGLPPIEAFAAELNQVWTNLVDNAIDAMEGTGTLRVATSSVDGGVLVEITDSGSGMSDEVRAHAFEPFFTTKEVGQGTGLGLDISRRIVVERHGGDIELDSEPGRTTVRVRLPMRPPQD